MRPVPVPEVIDPDRIISRNRDSEHLGDPRDHDQQLTDALHRSCSYAQQLWQALAAARTYLFDSLPQAPGASGPRPTTAFPRGPDDEDAWREWTDAYAAVTSALAGPGGDEGYGLDEAHEVARSRRAAVALAASGPAPAASPRRGLLPVPAPAAGQPPPGDAAPARRKLRIAATAALAVLAVRGLRRRP
jgi:hypothetical protein